MVVGRFYTVGTVTNSLFAALEDYLDMFAGDVTRTGVSLVDLYAGAEMTQYWAYEGSLTTPGCDEATIPLERAKQKAWISPLQCHCCCGHSFCCHSYFQGPSRPDQSKSSHKHFHRLSE